LSGTYNIAVGVSVLQSNTTGYYNQAVGYAALQLNTAGVQNVAVGAVALQANISGSNNAAVGVNALQLSTSSTNIGIGFNAGSAITTGGSNTIIGSVAGNASLSNTVIIAAGSAERMRIDSAGKMITLGKVETPDITSLLTTANTYPTTRPSLNLDFANSATLDTRITFTRGTNATYTGSDGLVKYTSTINSPRFDWDPVTRECKGLLIEEARTNLWTYSNDFNYDGTRCWQCSILANVTVAPDGTYSADKVIENATSNAHNTSAPPTVVSGTTYTFSAYVKAAERTYASFNINANNGAFAGTGVFVNLTAGTVSIAYGTPITYGIIDVGNGWKRVYMTQVAIANVTGVPSFGPAISGGEIYIGDGTSGIYIWGAQFEVGTFPTSYIPSSVTWTGRASTATYVGSNGLIQTAASGVARYQYNPTNLSVAPFLLLEPAATNLVTYSEQFDNAAWFPSARTISANSIASPNGTITADTINSSSSGFFSSLLSSITSGTSYTTSIYLKAGSITSVSLLSYGTQFNSGGANPGVVFDLASGTISAVTAAVGTITNMGNGWYRCTCTVIATTTTTNVYQQVARVETAGTFYVWGAQLETGSVATSYIPTAASQVTRIADTSTSAQTTRSADVATMTNSNFSSWYNQTEGTFVTQFDSFSTNAAGVYAANDTSASNRIDLRTNQFGKITIYVSSNGTSQFVQSGGTFLTNTFVKSANAYAASSFAQYADGSLQGVVGASGTIPVTTTLSIGRIDTGTNYLNGHIKRLTYYPTRLSNSTLQALTT
jgi:hypothetical protein